MDEPVRPATAYCFLDWRYEPECRRLAGPAGERRLKPLLDRLLRRLLEAPGAVLARDMLIEQVWTRREVNDEVLSRAIAELRALLGDDAREPRFVETLSKGGYRWIAPVARIGLPLAPAPDPPAVSAPPGRRHRIAAGAVTGIALLGLVLWLQSHRSGGDIDGPATVAVGLLDARPLATDPRLEYDPRFDAQGRIAYIRADPRDGASELVLVDPSNQAERVLWQDTARLRHPAPAPNGREIALMRLTAQGCELWSVATIDLVRSRLGDCAPSAAGGLEWVDDGAALIYTGPAIDPQHAPGLVRLDRAQGTRQALTTPSLGEGTHGDPRLSPDGTRLVYASRHGDEGQLWQTDWPHRHRHSPLLKRSEPLFGHAFAPDGSLWVAGDLTRYRALHRLRADGPPELVGGRGAVSLDLAADGTVVWSEARYDADLWLRDRAGAPWTAIARSNRYESQPALSPDGARVALVSNRGGTEAILVADRRDGRVQALPLDPRWRWVRPTWSAHDGTLILTAYEDRRTRLYRYRLDADVPEPIVHGADGAFHGTELPDRLLYLTGHGTADSQLMQRLPSRAAAERLPLGTVTAYRASPQWLVWRSQGSTSLRAAPWPNLQPVREIPTDGRDTDEAFALAQDTVVYLNHGRLWALRLSDGERSDLTPEHLPDAAGPSLAASPDGALAVAEQVAPSIDLMIAPRWHANTGE